MNPAVETVFDQERLCGWRKPEGIYLRGGADATHCGKLPIPIESCPHCGSGIKPSRGYTSISRSVLPPSICYIPSSECDRCLINRKVDKFGLMWVGDKFYKQGEFSREAILQGVSKRIAQVPKSLEIGKTIILIGERKAIVSPRTVNGETQYIPGVVMAFIPQRIEYVCRGDETNEEIEALLKRGITPVQVIRINEGKGHSPTKETDDDF